jgi:hypothetical protein
MLQIAATRPNGTKTIAISKRIFILVPPGTGGDFGK